LLTQLSSNGSQNVSASELGLELLETSEKDVQFLTFYQWFLKKLEILLLGSRELETADLEVFSGDWKHLCKQLHLERIFEQD
jgi:hypothetical protein